MKVWLALAPVLLVVMAYALTQGRWWSAVNLVFLEGLIFMNYRREKRRRSPEVPAHRNEV